MIFTLSYKRYDDDFPSTNIVIAESAEAVAEYAERYAWSAFSEVREADAEAYRRRGMPVVKL